MPLSKVKKWIPDPEMIQILEDAVQVWTEGEIRAKEYVRQQQIKKERAIKKLENYKKYGDADHGVKK